MFSRVFSPAKKTVIANTVSQLIGRAAGTLTTFVVTLIIAGQFGAIQYGEFIKVITYVSLFYIIADFGMNAIFLQHDEREYWPTLVSIRLLGSIVLMALALGILAVLPGSITQGYTPMVRLGILLLSPTILFQAMITSANGVFQKRFRYDQATYALIIGSAVTLALLLFFVFVLHTKHILAIVGIVGIGTTVTSLVSLLYAKNIVGRIPFVVTTNQVKQLLLPSVPLGITLLFNLVYFRADSIIITLFRSTSEVGIYGLAYKVFEVILVFPTFFMNAVYPFILKTKNVRVIFNKTFFFLLLSSVSALIIVWIGAPLLTYIKQDFVYSVTVLRVLALSLPLFFVTSVTMWTLIALKKQKALTIIYGSSMLVNVIGNMLLIPTHGYIAAAWMTLVGEGVVLVLSGLVLVKHV